MISAWFKLKTTCTSTALAMSHDSITAGGVGALMRNDETAQPVLQVHSHPSPVRV
jgi:hypothetical protein